MEGHVGLDCCMLCGEPKSIALATKYRRNAKGETVPVKKIPERFCSGPELCNKCSEIMKKDNSFVMYEAYLEENKKMPKFTGRYIIKSFETVDKNFEGYNFIDKNRFILCLPEEFEKIIGKDNDKT